MYRKFRFEIPSPTPKNCNQHPLVTKIYESNEKIHNHYTCIEGHRSEYHIWFRVKTFFETRTSCLKACPSPNSCPRFSYLCVSEPVSVSVSEVMTLSMSEVPESRMYVSESATHVRTRVRSSLSLSIIGYFYVPFFEFLSDQFEYSSLF